jgi:hypothetical protein
MDPIINPTTTRTGKWTADENKTLKLVVPTHGAINWEESAALIPGRTKRQCSKKWHNAFSNIDPATARMCDWTAEEDEKVKDAVRALGGKN